ncbi:hypothetical protein DICVIV_06196 [Dictyocaulus viviparus]|uniref:Beta-catenin-interacting ICAT domain-containing protein n=1 Tax=Dictyocaulus viviparus TaxID=29172 RepID=A0A0D8XVD6_DICVI|nr:hypothetical protein DICVIV_06196 [Dictyocaulus viviparus]
MADAMLVENLQRQLDRLMNQLSDIEEEKPNLDIQEYEEMKLETMDELRDLGRSLEKMTGGDISSTDSLTATRYKSCYQSNIKDPFSVGSIREKASDSVEAEVDIVMFLLNNDFGMQKISEKKFRSLKLEILTALVNLDEELLDEEKMFLHEVKMEDLPRFTLETISGNSTCHSNLE